MCSTGGAVGGLLSNAGLATSWIPGWGQVFAALEILSLIGTVADTVVRGNQESELLAGQVESMNAQARRARVIGERNAAAIEKKTAHDKRLEAQQFRRDQAQRRAVFGSGTGTGEVLAGARAQEELNLMAIGYSGQLDADAARYSGVLQSSNLDEQALILQTRRSNLQSSMPYTIGSTILSGGARAYRNHMRLN